MRLTRQLFCSVLIAAIAGTPAGAAEIYRWVAEDGVVHYSDEKPRDQAAFTTLEIADTRAQDYDPIEDPYSIRNQAQRINESWTVLAEARAQRLEARAQVPSPPRGEQPAYQQGPVYGTRFLSPWFYPSITPLFPQRVDQGAAVRQQRAIEGLELTSPRPASINSGVHRDRVQRSTALPSAGTATRANR